MKKRLLYLAALSLAVFASLPAEESGEKNAQALASITIDEIVNHIYYLASDELSGRSPGTGGYKNAAHYCASQLRAAGALPLVKSEDGTLSYYQAVPLKRSAKRATSPLLIGGNSFILGKSYGVVSTGKDPQFDLSGLDVVFTGYGITSKEAGWDDLEGLDLDGKIAVVMGGAPMKDGKPVLPENIHRQYSGRQQSIVAKFVNLKQHGAAAVILLPPPPELMPARQWQMMIGGVSSGRTRLDDGKESFDPMAFFDVPFLLATNDLSNALFEGAPYNPLTGDGEYGSFELDLNFNLAVEHYTERFTSPNVVAYVPGSDPEWRDEYVTVGAHLDHVGDIGGSIHNGADDNASGSAAVLEIAESVALNPPARSTIFILYTAEESGLLGSKHFVENAPVSMKDVVLNINLDMVGRETSTAPGGLHVIGSQMRSRELKEIIIEVNEELDGLALDFSTDEKDPMNLSGRSDHHNFHMKGVPVVFFNSGLHDDYHTPADDAELIDFEKIRHVSRLSTQIIQRVGNMPRRLMTN